MYFNNKKINEITEEDILNLIGNVREDQWVDFKQQAYKFKNEEDQFEILKDITAFANAEGGHLLIGVSEKNEIATGFFNIDNYQKIIKSIRYICLNYIEPRISNLEIKPFPISWEKKELTIIIIHVPPSNLKPHSIKWNNSTIFVKRYQDHIRDLPVSELGQLFAINFHPPIVEEINERLKALEINNREFRRKQIDEKYDALDLGDSKELINLMDNRFTKTIQDSPYYRIFVVPERLSDLIPTEDERIHKLLREPTGVRPNGFNFRGLKKISPTSEGIYGEGKVSTQELIVLRNGYVELRCSLKNSHFQWRRQETGIHDSEWLYPYAVSEYPYSFLKLVVQLFSEIGNSSDLHIRQEYRNIEGYILASGHPKDMFFGGNINIFEKESAIGRKLKLSSNFNPDEITFNLVKELYFYFNFDESAIPFFDENRNLNI